MLIFFLNFILIVTFIFTVLVALYVIINVLYILFVTKVPPVQTKRRYFHQIFSQYRINSETIVYDLGCGGGNFLMAAVKFEPKKCIGYELSLLPYLEARIKAWLWGRSRVKVLCKDFFKADIRDADLVFVYLIPRLLGRVAQKLRHEMKTGAVAIIKGAPLPEMKYVNKIALDEKRNYYAYIYKF